MDTKNTEKALELVNDRFNSARNFRVTTQDAIWKRSYNNWRGILDKSIYPWRSKLFVPWSFTVVETIIPKVFAREPKWRAIARNPDFPPDGPDTINDLLTYQWTHMGMRLKMYDYIKDALMYSKGYAKVTWKFKTKTTTIMEPQVGKNDEITFKKVTKSAIEHDDPYIEIVDPLDMYVDSDATSAGFGGNAAYMIQRKTIALKELKDNPNYTNVNKIKQTGGNNQYMDKLSRFNSNIPPEDRHKDQVEILEYWEQDRLVVVANRQIILRDSPNPFSHKQIPFVELDDYRDPHRYYGQSELSVIDPLQREINAIRNQRRDYDNLALNPVIRMVPGVLRNPSTAVMAPGSVWMVSDLNSMDVFELPQLQSSSTEIEMQTANDIKMSVAIDEIAIGLLPENPQRRSATEVMTSQNSAGKRFSMKVALLEEAVKKIGSLVFALNQQFLDREKIIQVVGEQGAQEWVKLNPEDIRGEYHIDIEAGSMLPRDELSDRNEAVQLLQYLAPIVGPAARVNPAVILPIMKLVLDTFELPGKKAILDELSQALGVAQQQIAQQAQAQTAQTQAQAVSAIHPVVNPQPAQPGQQ